MRHGNLRQRPGLLHRQNSVAKPSLIVADIDIMSDLKQDRTVVDVKQRSVGRPPAKHSSPDYAQMTIYVQKHVRNAVKMRLFQEGLELSALVERLLADWLTTRSPEGMK